MVFVEYVFNVLVPPENRHVENVPHKNFSVVERLSYVVVLRLGLISWTGFQRSFKSSSGLFLRSGLYWPSPPCWRAPWNQFKRTRCHGSL